VKTSRVLILCLLALAGAARAQAQIAMPDPSQISGVPLPAADLPAGTVSVRVIRGSFANNLAGVDVTFDVNGRSTVVKTDAGGRAQLSGLAPGAQLVASTIVDGERLVSQTVPIGSSGIRLVLAATDPAAAARTAEDQRLAAGPAARGTVVLGADSRVVAEFSNDRLNIYYILKVLNTARTPVEIGGPLVITLPQGARGVSMLEDSTPKATSSGEHVTVPGPFAPGTTNVNFAYELPYNGPSVRIEQQWPVALQRFSVFALKTGALDLSSPQLTSKQVVSQQGEQVIIATGGAIAAGDRTTIAITGLLYHARWPRYVALTLAGAFVLLGILGGASQRARAAARRASLV
jgi:hypothetical protein